MKITIQFREGCFPGWISPSITDVLYAADEWNRGLKIGQGSRYLQTVKALMLAGF